jgi:hypothetical protein
MNNGKANRWKRPDGQDKTQYDSSWSKKRFAWEYLRRSERYQYICNKVFGSHSDENELNAENASVNCKFPVRRLVNYMLDWKQAKSELKFVLRRKLVIVESEDKIRGESKDANFVMKFRIDLELILNERVLLKRALFGIEKEINKRLEELKTKHGKKYRFSRLHADANCRYLQFLDLKAANASSAEIKKVLFPRKSPANQSRMLDKYRKRVEGLMSGDARYLIAVVLGNAKA